MTTPAANTRERLKALLRARSLTRGEFKLASGRASSYYLDCRQTTLDPEGAVLTGHAILDLLAEKNIRADAIGGLTLGADPVVSAAVAMSHLAGRPLAGFYVRQERKQHGRQKLLEGVELKKGARVVIVDDVCTTGKSTRQAIEAAEGEGLEVVAVVSLVDREEGGSEELRRKYNYHSVFTARELLEETPAAPAV